MNRKNNKVSAEGYWLLMLMLGCMIITLMSFGNGISGNDFWWHQKIGEWIIEHYEIPQKDILSWCGEEIQASWTAHEWLSEVIFYLIYHYTGKWGIWVMVLAVHTSLTFCIGRDVWKKGKDSILICTGYILFLILVSLSIMNPRPRIFSYCLLYTTLKIIDSYLEKPRNIIWFMPLISVLWSNLHGGSAPMIYVLCLLALFSHIRRFSWNRIEGEQLHKKDFVRLLIVTAVCFFSIGINPIGIKVLIYPFQNLSDEVSMKLISEWQSPDPKNMGTLLMVYLPMILTSMGFVVYGKKIKVWDLLLWLFFSYMSLRSRRFIMEYMITASIFAFRNPVPGRLKQFEKKWEVYSARVCTGVLLVALFTTIYIKWINLQNCEVISTVVDDRMVEVIKEDSPQRIYNDYNCGADLIAHDIPVFIDSRADTYAANGIFQDYAHIRQLSIGFEASLSQAESIQEIITYYNFDAFLVDKNTAIYWYLLELDDKYRVLFEEENYAYFSQI